MSSRWCLSAACVAAALLVAVVLVGGVMMVGAFDVRPVLVQGRAEVDVNVAGAWVIASMQRAEVDGTWHTGRDIDAMAVSVVTPAGASIDITQPVRDVHFVTPAGAGKVIGTFDAAPGVWIVEASGGPALIGIGPDPVAAMTPWLLGAGAIAICLGGIAAALVWLAWTRRGTSGASGVHSCHGPDGED